MVIPRKQKKSAQTNKTRPGFVSETGKTIEYMMINTEEQADLATRMKPEVKSSMSKF